MRNVVLSLSSFLVFLAGATPSRAQQVLEPTVKKAAEDVYIFGYKGYQSMFVVAPEGVLVTDPISPEAAKLYLTEVRKVSQAPALNLQPSQVKQAEGQMVRQIVL